MCGELLAPGVERVEVAALPGEREELAARSASRMVIAERLSRCGGVYHVLLNYTASV